MIQVAFWMKGKYGKHKTVVTISVVDSVDQVVPVITVTASAKCHRGDKADKAFGRRLALQRATNKLKDVLFLPRYEVRSLWDQYYATYEPHTVRGKAVVKTRQVARSRAAANELVDRLQNGVGTVAQDMTVPEVPHVPDENIDQREALRVDSGDLDAVDPLDF